MRMTPSRTVAIWGRVFGLTIVAIRLPPKAGRIWKSRFRIGPVVALEVVVADLQVGAVGGQAAAQGAGDARREVAAVGRAADQEDLRPAPARLRDRHARVREGAVVGQLRVVGQQDAVGAVPDDVAAPAPRRRARTAGPTTS